MAHIPGYDRSQMLLLPETVDDYVGPDNPVRFIEAFVDGLDLEAAGFARGEPKTTGRPALLGSSPNRQVGRAMHRLICSSSTSTATSIGSAPVGGWRQRRGGTLRGSGCFAPSSPTSSPLPTSAATIATPSGRSSARSCCCAANSTCSGAS